MSRGQAPVAVLTAAPHRYGKAISLALAREGFDVALFGLGTMKARASAIEELGHRGRAVLPAVRSSHPTPPIALW